MRPASFLALIAIALSFGHSAGASPSTRVERAYQGPAGQLFIEASGFAGPGSRGFFYGSPPVLTRVPLLFPGVYIDARSKIPVQLTLTDDALTLQAGSETSILPALKESLEAGDLRL